VSGRAIAELPRILTGTHPESVGERAVTLELDIYSGRPNPRWDLTEAETAHLHELLRNLPQSGEAVELKLGYRGFVLIEGSRRITVANGLVRTDEHGHQLTYLDTSGVELYLRQLARDRGYGNLLEIPE
jgi:hypothetical protein